MKKNLLLSLFALLGTTTLFAQQADGDAPKWDARISTLLTQQAEKSSARTILSNGTTSAVAQDTVLHVIIKATDSQFLADSLNAAGYRAKVIANGVITARLPLSAIPAVAKSPSLRFINSSRRHKALLDKARPSVGADKIHAGTDLDTPYKGAGVIVAVIDRGFQYNHAAFTNADGKSRVIAVWDQSSKKSPVLTDITEENDGIFSSGGHGTHVAGIAAASDKGNAYYGMAPEADIIMIPSTFEDAELLEDLVFIDSIATAQGKPVVTNMSFGSTMGAHDGTGAYNETANTFIAGKEGRIITAAMGNDADSKLHAHHSFTKDNESVSLLIKPNSNGQVAIDVWGNKTDSLRHLSFIPAVYDASSGAMTTRRVKNYWKESINADNKKENGFFGAPLSRLVSTYTDPHLLITVKGNAGDEFHAWLGEDYGTFVESDNLLTNLVAGDNDYCVGEGAASIPNAVAVGSYTTSVAWRDINGNQAFFKNYANKSPGEISYFSSHGPSLGAEPKPTIVAPGAIITAPFNRYDDEFSLTDITMVVDSVKLNSVKDYYGVMQGTSMASPAVAGIVALWLEANPKLTSEEVLEILRTTAKKDVYTTTDDWNKISGYGKIDAYAGLKAALGKVNGIEAIRRSETPVTIERNGSSWRLLFGSIEQNVTVQVYSVSGQLLQTKRLAQVVPGQEETVSFSSLPAGVYVLRITAPASSLVRKVVR